MKRTHTKLFIALLTALLLAAGCGSDDEDDTPAAEYKVLGGRLVWCSGGAEDMVVPATASSIGNNAFGNCGAIGTLTIPTSVTHIMRYTFSGVRVGKIFFGGTVAEWAAMAEQDGFGDALRTTPVICSDGEWKWTAPAVPVKPNDWQITDGVLVKYSGSAADVEIPDSVTAIGNGAFAGCADITHVTIPRSVTSIGENAFKNCEKLTSIEIPGGVTSIGENAFSGCDSLTSVDIPASVTDIGAGAIPAETSVTYHGTAERWDELAEDGGLDGITVFIRDENGTLTGYRGNAADITIPDGVTAIGADVFAEHDEIKHIVIPAGVTGIAPGAFAGSGITEIEYKGDLTAWGALVEAGGIADELAGITVTCTDGTWTPAHTHTWGEAYTNGGADGHYKTCTGCDERSTTEAHTYGGAPQADGDGGHCQTCTGCGAHSPTVAHDYAYSDDSSTTHTMTCTGCNYTKTEAHAYGGEAYTDAGHVKTCAGCKHSETAQHTWGDTYENGDNGHYLTCTTAGCGVHSPAEEHTYGGETHTSAGGHYQLCTAAGCGARSGFAPHTYGGTPQADGDGGHYQSCTLAGCDARSTIEPHNYTYSDGGTTHTMTCTECDYAKTEAHAYGSETFTDAGHTKTFTGCEHTETTLHVWSDTYTKGGSDGHYRTCTTAGCNAHSTVEAHTYGAYTDDNDGSNHSKTCSVCKRTERGTHQYGTTYADDKNGKHSQTCSVCAATKTASHTYGTTYTSAGTTGHYQTCTACDARSATKPHDCSYSGIDADNHEERCKTCTYSATVAHTYAYTRTDAVHHSGVCAGCNARVEGDRHVYSGDSCRNCGSPKPVLGETTINDNGVLTKYSGTATAVEIPEGVIGIGMSAFMNGTITSVTIPVGVSYINDSAFNGCTSLTSVTIPDSVTYIAYKAFYNCKSLTTIAIPASVTKIERQVFENCTKLETVNYDGTQEQWETITKYSDYGLAGKTITGSDGSTWTAE